MLMLLKVDIKKLNAMTLLELIVVVALIGIFSTVAMIDNDAFKYKRVAISEQQKMYSFLSNLQNTAFSENENVLVTINSTLLDTNKLNDVDNIFEYEFEDKIVTTFSSNTFTVNNDRTFSNDVTITFSKDDENFSRIIIYGSSGFIMKQIMKDNTWEIQ